MTEKDIRLEVSKATVGLPSSQGVLVSGNMIVTAAHCLENFDYNIATGAALGDYSIWEIKTRQGMLKLTPLAVEPCSDVAILGPLDNQEFEKEAEEFEEFCSNTPPVQLCRQKFELFKQFPVHILTHKGWVTGSAQLCRKEAHTLCVEADKPIKGGASGGPIINDRGELVGIISVFRKPLRENEKIEGHAPRPHLALPVWVCREILKAERRSRTGRSLKEVLPGRRIRITRPRGKP